MLYIKLIQKMYFIWAIWLWNVSFKAKQFIEIIFTFFSIAGLIIVRVSLVSVVMIVASDLYAMTMAFVKMAEHACKYHIHETYLAQMFSIETIQRPYVKAYNLHNKPNIIDQIG